MKLLTDGLGRYCTTRQEDNATHNALMRAAATRKVDLKRLAVLAHRVNTDFRLNASKPVSLVYNDVVQENPILKGFRVFDIKPH